MFNSLRTLCLGVALLVAGCATGLPPAPGHPNGLVLWGIVHGQCVPGEVQHQDPKPCAVVSLDGGEARGFVVLKDRDGATQYLLMPSDKITGIEDPKLLAPGVTNYFAKAWDQRGLVEDRLGGPVPREDLSVAVNSVYGRSQDQLHLHIDCLDAGVRAALAADAPQIGPSWSSGNFVLAGHRYRVRRIDAAELGQTDPFRLLADEIPGARRNMGAWTLVLAGETSNGAPGFYLIATRANPAAGEMASGESLQDHACKGTASAQR